MTINGQDESQPHGRTDGLAAEDIEAIQSLYKFICHESGHGEIIVRIRENEPNLITAALTVIPPSRQALTV
jgi:hypothetical protein